jgi:adhesin transport system outer membrane protein
MLMTGGARAASLADELAGLMQDHPSIKSGEDAVAAANKGVAASLAPYLPSVDGNGDEGKGRVSLPFFRQSLGGPFDATEENWTITAKENVWDGGAKESARAQAKIQRDAANISLTAVRQNVLSEGITAYLNVLRHDQLVKLSQQNTETIRNELHLEDERVKRGSGIAVDVLQAKSRLQVADERLVAVQGGMRDASVHYEQVFNHQPIVSEMTLPPPADAVLPATEDDAVAAAVTSQPAVLNAAKLITLAEEKKKGVESEYQPRFDIVGSKLYEHDWAGIPGYRRDSLIELRTTWNLFAGLGTLNRVRQTAEEYESRNEDLIQAKRKAEEQVRVAWNALVTARSRADLLENGVNIASEVFENRKKLRESGKETAINVLDAENEVFNAQINYVSATYDARIAAYEVLHVIGALDLARLNLPK